MNSNTILCVDDDEDDLYMLREAINKVNPEHKIIEAFDGLHALELLKDLHQKNALPSLIVLDINMPRMDGKQTLIALQKDKIFSTIPVVVFSTSSSLLDKTFYEARNVQFITKPLTMETLYKTASKILSYRNTK